MSVELNDLANEIRSSSGNNAQWSALDLMQIQRKNHGLEWEREEFLLANHWKFAGPGSGMILVVFNCKHGTATFFFGVGWANNSQEVKIINKWWTNAQCSITSGLWYRFISWHFHAPLLIYIIVLFLPLTMWQIWIRGLTLLFNIHEVVLVKYWIGSTEALALVIKYNLRVNECGRQDNASLSL